MLPASRRVTLKGEAETSSVAARRKIEDREVANFIIVKKLALAEGGKARRWEDQTLKSLHSSWAGFIRHKYLERKIFATRTTKSGCNLVFRFGGIRMAIRTVIPWTIFANTAEPYFRGRRTSSPTRRPLVSGVSSSEQSHLSVQGAELRRFQHTEHHAIAPCGTWPPSNKNSSAIEVALFFFDSLIGLLKSVSDCFLGPGDWLNHPYQRIPVGCDLQHSVAQQ